MHLAIQIVANDKKVRSDTVQYLKELRSQSLATQAKKGQKIVSMMPAIKKAFNLMGDDIVELSTENDALKNKIGDYDEKWLQESKNNLLKQIDDERRANLFMSKMKKTDGKTLNIWLISVIMNYGKAGLITLFLKKISCKI